MRGPRCGIARLTTTLEAAVVAIEALAPYRNAQTDRFRAALAEAQLAVRDLREHVEHCEECEAP